MAKDLDLPDEVLDQAMSALKAAQAHCELVTPVGERTVIPEVVFRVLEAAASILGRGDAVGSSKRVSEKRLGRIAPQRVLSQRNLEARSQ